MMEVHHFGPLLACTPTPSTWPRVKLATRDFARRAFTEDLARLEELPCHLYNFHPGSHVGQGSEQGIQWITDILNECLQPDEHHRAFGGHVRQGQ